MSMRAETTADDDYGPNFDRLADKAQQQLRYIISATGRQKKAIGLTVVACVALCIAYLLQAVPYYMGTTSLLIDAKQVGLSATNSLEGSLAFDTGAVDSQVLVIQSDRLAGSVIDRLGLLDNRDFTDPPSSLIGMAIAEIRAGVIATLRWAGVDSGAPDFADLPVEVRRIILIQKLEKNLTVTRNQRTYVLTIQYTDPDRMLSRNIANAYASAYLEDQLEAKFDATRRASIWLDERIREVKSRANAADQAVQAFRTRNNLTAASGRLINEQALTDANTQLSIARNDLNSAKAKFDRLKQIVDSKEYSASVVDSLSSPLIAQLRSKYLLASKLDADITSKLGAQHYQAINARKEMAQYEQLMFEELTRLLQSYQSEVSIAADRVGTLERSIDEMRKANTIDSEAMSKLKSLEQEASTYNGLYTSYLQKAQDLLQQQSFPVTDARIITEAAIPLFTAGPKMIIFIPVSLILGLILGSGLAVLREYRERGFRTSSQVRRELGLDFISYIPTLPKESFRKHRSSETTSDNPAARLVQPTSDGLAAVLNDPLSRYSESLRAIKIATDFRFGLKRPLVLGFVSMFPNEGKSTAAKNFASLVAAQGEKVLLIDGDFRNPQLTRDLTPKATVGLVDLLHNAERSLTSVLHVEERSNLAFLPGAAHRRLTLAGDALGSHAMSRLIEAAARSFDLIVVDLPPIGAVIDAIAAARFIDGYHLVIEWGKTPREAVRDMLIADPVLAEKTIGVVLSKVELERLSMFDAHASYGYTGEYQSRYYGSNALT